MSILKKIGLGFLGFLVLLVAVSFVLPGKIRVERSMVMQANAASTFAQINNLKNWGKWSPWHQMDSTMKITYEGPEAGAGAQYNWVSEKMGNGSLLISESNPEKNIKATLNFGGMGTSYAEYKFEPVAEGTKVIWAMESDAKDTPWQWYVPSKYMNLFMPEMLGKDFETGLTNLKKIVESQPAAPVFNVEEKTIPAVQVLAVKAVCSQEELPNKLGELFGQMVAEMQKSKLEFAGHPSAVYHKYDPQAIEFEAIIPVNKAGKTNGKIVAKEMKGGPVAMISHYGPYEGTFNAHLFMDVWLTQQKKAATGSPWEVYVTDPMKEKDPAKWLTEIYYPL